MLIYTLGIVKNVTLSTQLQEIAIKNNMLQILNDLLTKLLSEASKNQP